MSNENILHIKYARIFIEQKMWLTCLSKFQKKSQFTCKLNAYRQLVGIIIELFNSCRGTTDQYDTWKMFRELSLISHKVLDFFRRCVSNLAPFFQIIPRMLRCGTASPLPRPAMSTVPPVRRVVVLLNRFELFFGEAFWNTKQVLKTGKTSGIVNVCF